jgi:hypothetical protein
MKFDEMVSRFVSFARRRRVQRAGLPIALAASLVLGLTGGWVKSLLLFLLSIAGLYVISAEWLILHSERVARAARSSNNEPKS